jgi:hypothetical protein
MKANRLDPPLWPWGAAAPAVAGHRPRRKLVPPLLIANQPRLRAPC